MKTAPTEGQTREPRDQDKTKEFGVKDQDKTFNFFLLKNRRKNTLFNTWMFGQLFWTIFMGTTLLPKMQKESWNKWLFHSGCYKKVVNPQQLDSYYCCLSMCLCIVGWVLTDLDKKETEKRKRIVSLSSPRLRQDRVKQATTFKVLLSSPFWYSG